MPDKSMGSIVGFGVLQHSVEQKREEIYRLL